jgi:hypothetical protein
MPDAFVDPASLPSWLDSLRAVEARTATPLERFIAANEPTSAELRELFRAELAAALAEARGRRRGRGDPGRGVSSRRTRHRRAEGQATSRSRIAARAVRASMRSGRSMRG